MNNAKQLEELAELSNILKDCPDVDFPLSHEEFWKDAWNYQYMYYDMPLCWKIKSDKGCFLTYIFEDYFQNKHWKTRWFIIPLDEKTIDDAFSTPTNFLSLFCGKDGFFYYVEWAEFCVCAATCNTKGEYIHSNNSKKINNDLISKLELYLPSPDCTTIG